MAINFALGEIVLGAQFHRLKRYLFVRESGQNYDRYLRLLAMQTAERLNPMTIREGEIQQDNVNIASCKPFSACREALCVYQLYAP